MKLDTQFTCFTSTKAQVLTPEALLGAFAEELLLQLLIGIDGKTNDGYLLDLFYFLYLLYWFYLLYLLFQYRSTNTDT